MLVVWLQESEDETKQEPLNTESHRQEVLDKSERVTWLQGGGGETKHLDVV